MKAICPKCRCELPEIGWRCENDGWFGVDPQELEYPDTIVGRPLGGSFYAFRHIGQGGMGTVYEGRQLPFNRVVAIKVLSLAQLNDPQVLARFKREAQSVARVSHPNVVKLIDSGVEDGSVAYIVMEFVRGTELSAVPASEISGQFIVHVAYQVLSALSEAHAMGVIHRDLKPDNIMLTVEDNDVHFVKVLDFGLASINDRAKITFSGQALGTPWYMSPEQATASNVTYASDIYSLGCILYELATSKPPFPGNRPFNVMMQHVNAQVPPLQPRPEVELSPQIIAFIMKCLEKAPENRFETAAKALEALFKLPEWASVGQSSQTQSLIHNITQISKLAESSISNIVDANDISDVVNSDEFKNLSSENPALSMKMLARELSSMQNRASLQISQPTESAAHTLPSIPTKTPTTPITTHTNHIPPKKEPLSLQSLINDRFSLLLGLLIAVIVLLIIILILLFVS